MKYIITIFAVHFFVNAYPQNCNTGTLLQKAGAWKESSAGMQGVAAADLARQKKTLATIHNMIRSRYSPRGVDAHYNNGYNRPLLHLPVNTYTYSIIPLDFYCDGDVVKTVHETSTYFQVGINFFAAEIYDTAAGGRLLLEGFNVLPQMPVEKDGYYYFEEKDVTLGFGIPGKSAGWLITYDGKIPYAYVSKKEFLEKRKEILKTQMQSEAAGIKDVLKNIEMEKGFKETEYKNDPDKLQRYMKMAYLPTKERYGKQLSDLEKTYEPAFDKIESMLQWPSNELQEQAIVKNDPNDHLSYLFTDANDPFGKVLIKPNPAYFNKKLPRSSPQFISIYLRGNPKEDIAAATLKDLIKAVDFAALKDMLGK
jgi:hypothetical protein